jgi:hypothetical protein
MSMGLFVEMSAVMSASQGGLMFRIYCGGDKHMRVVVLEVLPLELTPGGSDLVRRYIWKQWVQFVLDLVPEEVTSYVSCTALITVVSI